MFNCSPNRQSMMIRRRAAFTDAIAEVPVDADPDFTMTETDDLLLRRSVAEGRHLPYR
jgi:hypothetical protein